MKADTAAPPPANSIPGLIRELRNESATLLQQEVALAKTELKENASQLGLKLAEIAIGGFVASTGLVVLLIGLGQLLGVALERAGLSADISRWLAPTVLGLIVVGIGGLMFLRAKQTLSADLVVPRQSIDSLQEDKQWVKRTINRKTHEHRI